METETPDRVRQIVDAAYELLDEAGLEGLTIRAVLARTGLARRAFYDRFAGKDDLVLAVFEQTLKMAARYFVEAGAGLPDAEARIRQVVRGIVVGRSGLTRGAPGEGDRRAAALAREHLRLAEARPDELQAALAPLLDYIASQVMEGIASGRFRACDPALQSTLVYNLLSTTAHTELLRGEGGPADLDRRRRLADEVWEFCRRALAA